MVTATETAPNTEEATAGEEADDAKINSQPGQPDDDAASTAGEALIEGGDCAVIAFEDDTVPLEGQESVHVASAKSRTGPGTPRAETPAEAQSVAIVDSAGNAEQRKAEHPST